MDARMKILQAQYDTAFMVIGGQLRKQVPPSAGGGGR